MAKWAALAAFYMPNYDSHRRIYEEEWGAWSFGNRLTAICTIKSGYWVSVFVATLPFLIYYLTKNPTELKWR